MAGLSSKAADALKKVMSRTMFHDLNSCKGALKDMIKSEETLTAGREFNAENILSVEKYVDGTEIWPKGDLFMQLTKGLDESGLRSALSVVQSRMDDLHREETAYIEKARVRHERIAPELRFDPPVGKFDR